MEKIKISTIYMCNKIKNTIKPVMGVYIDVVEHQIRCHIIVEDEIPRILMGIGPYNSL